MHIVEKPSNPDAGPRFRRRSFELQSLKDVLLAVVLGGVWLAVILNLDHVRGSWPVRGALIALLTFGILVAIDRLLQSATQRITPTGVGAFGVTGWRWLRWNEVTAWSGVGSGRWLPVNIRIWSGSKALDVRPSAYQEPDAVREYLEGRCGDVPRRKVRWGLAAVVRSRE